MRLQSVSSKFTSAKLARNQSLRARIDFVSFQAVPLDFSTAFMIAIHRLEAAQVVFVQRACKILVAKWAGDQAFGAGVQHVILH